MNKHTPGPWLVGNRYRESGVFSADGETLVASTHGSARNWRRQEQIAEQDANARLIAAAPELLEALEYLAAIAGTGLLHRQSLDKQGMVELFEEARAAALAAIAKAEGDEQ